MNWLDWTLLALLAFAAVRGFLRGFVVEVASLVALVLGIWAAARYNARMSAWVGLDPEHEVIAFLLTFFAVLFAVHLLAKLITKAMDLAMLGLPNKVAGTLFGALRAAFMLSVIMNIALARMEHAGPVNLKTLEGSMLFGPLRDFAPMLVPALKETKWMQHALDALGHGQAPPAP